MRSALRCLAAAAAVSAGALAFAGGAAAVQPSYNDVPPDGCGTIEGSQGSSDYDLGSCDTESSEDPIYYAAVDGYVNPCKSFSTDYVAKSLFQVTLFRYRQRTTWCWNGSKVTYVFRERYPLCCFPIWDFKGHTYNSCSSEYCSEKKGGWSAYVATQGKFTACALYWWACQNVYAGVWQTVYGNGTRTSGLF